MSAGCAADEDSGGDKARVEGALAGGQVEVLEDKPWEMKQCKIWRWLPPVRTEELLKGSKQLQGMYRSGSRWLPSKSTSEAQCRNAW